MNLFRRIINPPTGEAGKMADDNRPLKYARYAIGEIVLVVIGILIALQINNWNEDRKTKQEEVKALKELKGDLLLNIEDFSENVYGYKLSGNANKTVIKIIDQDLEYHDSLMYVFGRLYPLVTMVANNGTYESLKERGLNLISNDSLRKVITRYYSKDIIFVKTVESKNVQAISDAQLTPFLMKEFRTIEPFVLRPNDFDSLRTNNYFRELLANLDFFCYWSVSKNNDLIATANQLINMIDQELAPYQ